MGATCEPPEPPLVASDTVHLRLAEDARAAAEARRAARETLMAWRLPRLVDAVVLAVSELVGNAVRHGLPPIALTLRRRHGEVRVDVHDEHPASPTRDSTRSGANAESGRGLSIVDALADDVGIDLNPGDGKTVYATFRTDRDVDR